MTTWQVQMAKQRFSEMLREAEAGEPQFITKHGAAVAVVINIADFRSSHGPHRTFEEFLVQGLGEVGLEEDLELPERTVDPDRTIGLFEDDE